ncbi:MAG: SpoIIE family protein phosphatase [Treponema sp.]|jgi:HAMP domain-containing protein|nr:SpoIIE family protein phosphatase [Treponema sp.]
MTTKRLLYLALFVLFALPLSAQEALYWEQPAPFSPGQGNFPVSYYSGDMGILLWQESSPWAGAQGGVRAGSGNIYISLAVKKAGTPWENRGIIGGPYVFSGAEPAILSAVIDNSGRIIIAAAASSGETEILISGDEGCTFQSYRINSGDETSVAPRIAVRADGGYLLFITRGIESSWSVYYARSDDAVNWTPFQPFITEPDMYLNFLPSHTALGTSDYVVFQSFIGSSETIPAFQLFLKRSDDGGSTWSAARRITNFTDNYISTSSAQSVTADYYDNQRPYLSTQGNSLFLVWERRFRTGSPQIFAVRMDRNGNLNGQAERINSVEAYCNNPIAFSFKGALYVVWFDNRWGQNRVFLAQQSGIEWQNRDLSGITGRDASFGRPIVEDDDLYIFWQLSSNDNPRIYALFPDTSVASPRITAQNFVPGRRTRGDRVQLSWNIPQDSSGVMGFSYSWSQDPNAVPEERVRVYNQGDYASTNIELAATEEGIWYFTIITNDFAGNWSLPSRIEYIRDTTPPPAAVIVQPSLDPRFFMTSNTFSLEWYTPPVPDLAGFAWNLEYLGSAYPFEGMNDEEFQAAAEHAFPTLSIGVTGIRAATSVSYNNQDDGVWGFAVQAVDEAGNIGHISVYYLRTNKYIPQTYITWVDAIQDEQGILRIKIYGRGFAENGNISRIILEKAGGTPWIREFELLYNNYTVLSDREIDGLLVEDIDEGYYRIILEHPVRGIYTGTELVSVGETATVKFGNYYAEWGPSWMLKESRRFVFDTGYLVIIAISAFCILGLLVSLRGIGSVISETAAMKHDAAVLITGDFMPIEKKKHITRIKRRGMGLRLKLASFTAVLVLVVVIMVSLPLYLMMTNTQRETLLRGLWDRSTVLLEGLAANVRAFLPQRNILELGFLPAQMLSIPEARYVTITGYNPETTVFDDQVWATNDTDILRKIDTREFQPGISRITDVLDLRLNDFANELNAQARLQASNLSETIVSLNQEARELAEQAIRTNTEADAQRLEQIQITITALETRLNGILSEIASVIGSEPEFSIGNLNPGQNQEYIFFKPVMYRQGSEDYYVRGIIRLEVSISSIIDEMNLAQQGILRIILLVALAAMIIGTVGALVLSTLIISPIMRLVSHVEQIRDTEDKADLEGVEISIKSKDEIATLGATINEMTQGLVKAAAAASDLSIGKEIQKKFIPLDLDTNGDKLSSGYKDTKNADFFGYYEGAKGVSGDYFDYKDLDGRYFAIIKCDVAGKGIPAALIMIQVATMFLNYFKQWKPTEKGMHIEDVVYQINDFIETLNFKGRFAAFTLCLFDSVTGLIRFCNAGDNIVHTIDASEKRMKTITLPETPATGVLPNFLVEAKGGYKVETLTIDHGDILLLYTDGIEEAKRKFRDQDFAEISCQEGPANSPHENHVSGQEDEEMGPDRVETIVKAVMNKEVYTLHKWHNPEGEADLSFDFTNCEGSIDEVIMAMVSVEKMFRCYKSPKATEDNRVLVDKKVDVFLKEHFLQYRTYCSFTREVPGNDAYIYYTHLLEDEQYDDLTILGIRRK